MDCICLQACNLPNCIETLEIGTITPDSIAYVRIKDLVTGRIKDVEGLSDEDGLLVIDVEDITGFFSPSLIYEITVHSSLENDCELYDLTIDEVDVPCIRVQFYTGTADLAKLKLKEA